MDAGKAIYNMLINDAGVVSKIGTRVYPGFVPQDTQFPALTYSFTVQSPSGTKDGVSKLDVLNLLVTIYHEDETSAQDLADAVRSVLDFYKGTQNGVTFNRITFTNQTNNSFESEYQFVVLTQDYNVRMLR